MEDEVLTMQWNGVAGKAYTIQTWKVESGTWEVVMSISPQLVDQAQSYEFPSTGEAGIYRLGVRDVDGDGDGLNAWEELQLGWHDDDAHSSGSLTVADYEAALTLLEQPEGVSLVSGEVLPQRLPEAAEAARFLVQSTFGPTTESIQEVMQLGMSGWLDQQLAMSVTTTSSQLSKTGQPYSAVWWRHAWWRAALVAPDQLRHRMAYALSQIFVVNNEPGSVIGDNPYTKASYYDPFVAEAFGSYRDILEHVTYSPSMGFYLSHMNNRKSNLEINRFPDENFAREVMQLFSIGLWELESDGSRRLDSEGNDIPTYDNSVITEMAKVFTGMSNGTTMRGQPASSFYDLPTGDDYRYPLKVWDEEHEPGPKFLFKDVVIPDGQTGEEDVQQALDALATHDNTAPFICRLLIQRLTSSNPSPGYLRRVSLAWQEGEGNLGKVVRAILFDPEARTWDRREGIRGKVREPLIRMTHIMRAFALPDESGRYAVSPSTLKGEFGQFVMSSPSVFNFYLPDYSPIGPLHDRDLVAPEFQIATVSSLLATHDRLKYTAIRGHQGREIDYTEELAMLDDVESLIDHLDVLLTFGTMSATTREAVLDRVVNERFDLDRVRIAVQVIVTSPEFSVLK
ncbi:DUF1800 family protein [Verrucomicrobiaceae bacterium 227]